MPDAASLRYRPQIPELVSEPVTPESRTTLDAPDRRDGRVYDLPDELHLAVEVALVTGRPLLLRGEPGSGKSSLAAFVARNLRWRYYEHVVTSTTRAQDLLWRYDTVRRLSDAQVRDHALDDADYVEPGVLWWAFDPASARTRGTRADAQSRPSPATDPNADDNRGRDPGSAVVLVDEIDKADPDLPNGLLGPLGSTYFVVHETGVEVRRPARTEAEARQDRKSHVLIVITTNEERDLPPAFVRRCVVHRLERPDPDRLVRIARLHFAHAGEGFDEELARALAQRLEEMRETAEPGTRPPSAAEYLDALRACIALGITVGTSRAWEVLAEATLTKGRGDGVDVR